MTLTESPARRSLAGAIASAEPAPIPGGERMAVLDVLRGLALCGILLANIHFFSGYFVARMAGTATLTAADERVLWLTHFLVDGKFYSLFSLLFGIGFYVFMHRAEAKGIAPVPLFRRRLWWLLAIGLAHAVLLWSGDILTVYALMGFLLVPFRRVSTPGLLRWAAAMLALPVAAYALMWATGMTNPLGGPPEAAPSVEVASVPAAGTVTAADAPPDAAAPSGGFDPMAIMMNGFKGGYVQVLQANALMLVGRWVDLFITLRFPKVLGMFLIGFYVGRTGLARDLGANTGLFRRVLLVGLVVGLPANAYLAWSTEHVPYLPGSAAGFLTAIAYAVGVPALSLAYAAGATLLVQRASAGRVMELFAPVGRMALTNYLLQSLVCALIFYGYGLGLFGRVGPAVTALIALGIFAAQVPLSRLWLSRFAYGPAEWVWRRLTYRMPVAMRRSAG